MIKTQDFPKIQVVPPKRKIVLESVPLGMEVIAGFVSGLLVSPFNTIVDKAVIENSSGRIPLWKGVK